jgi:hypothetical protein
LSLILCIAGYSDHDLCLFRLFEDTLDGIASLADTNADQWTMLNDDGWISKPATHATATLSEASWMVAIEAVAVVIFLSTDGAALCTGAILLTAVLTDVTLHRDLYSMSIIISKLTSVVVALPIILRHSTLEYCSNFDGNAWIPALGRGWLLFEMSIPHFLQALIDKRWATAQ